MRILFTPYGGGSIAHLVRSFAVADQLREEGHEVLFTAPTTKKEFVEKAGYEVFGNGHAEVNLNDEKDQSITYFHNHREEFIDWLGDEVKAAQAFQPDIIVNSPTFFGPAAALKLGIPHVTIINAQWLTEYKGILGLGLSKDLPHHALLRRLANPIFAKKFEKIYMEEIQGYYETLEIGYVPKRRRDLHRHAPALIPSVPTFEPIHRTARSDIHYVGPLIWQGFEKEPFNPTELFPNFGSRPFVYLSLGGSIYRKESYDTLIKALANRTEWHTILSLGPNFPRNKFPADTANLVIRSYVPGLRVCEYADVVINTGSHGTVMQALWHGKPVIAIPHNIDQATIGSRLTELRLGLNLNKVGIRDFTDREAYFRRATNVSPETIIRATEQVLKHPKMAERCRAFSQELHQYEHAHRNAAHYVTFYAKGGARD